MQGEMEKMIDEERQFLLEEKMKFETESRLSK